MDILSYGTASKASKEESNTRNKVLGEGVTGSFSTVKERIDNIDNAIGNVTKQADNLIIKNAVNIMKANAKLNAVAQSKKYEMNNMIFDDLLDLSGIDNEKSRNYTHDSVTGVITAGEECVIETKEEITQIIPEQIVLHIEHVGTLLCSISRNNGTTWESIIPNELFYFNDSVSLSGNKIRIKVELSVRTKLLNYALTWT